MRSFSPSKSDFAAQVTLSARRGAERHAVGVVRIVVVVIAVRVDVIEVIVVVGRPQPPVRGGTLMLQRITQRKSYGKSLYRSLSFFIVPLIRRISFSTMSIQNFILLDSIPNSSFATSI